MELREFLRGPALPSQRDNHFEIVRFIIVLDRLARPLAKIGAIFPNGIVHAVERISGAGFWTHTRQKAFEALPCAGPRPIFRFAAGLAVLPRLVFTFVGRFEAGRVAW